MVAPDKNKQLDINSLFKKLEETKKTLTKLIAKKVKEEELNIYAENLETLKQAIDMLIDINEKLIQVIQQEQSSITKQIENLHGELNIIEKKMDDLFIKINYIISLLKIEK